VAYPQCLLMSPLRASLSPLFGKLPCHRHQTYLSFVRTITMTQKSGLIDRIDQRAKTELLKILRVPRIKRINGVADQGNGKDSVKGSS
jgi:hypothetical protein